MAKSDRWDDSPGAWQRGYDFAKESALHETRAEQRAILQRVAAHARSAYDRGFVAAYQDTLGDARSGSGRHHATKKKTGAQLDREIADYMKANPYVRSESEKQIHPEVFACLDRHGKILGTSRTVRGAMALAPDDTSYALVRGEYTSDGSNWGVGRGKQHAVREGSGRRWQVG